MGRTVEKCTEIEAGRGTRDETHPRHRLLRDNSRTERVEPPRLLLIQDVPQQPSQPQPSASLSPLSSLLSPLSSLLSPPPSPPLLLPLNTSRVSEEGRTKSLLVSSSPAQRPPPRSSPSSHLLPHLLPRPRPPHPPHPTQPCPSSDQGCQERPAPYRSRHRPRPVRG